jgi:hypothetical protein
MYMRSSLVCESLRGEVVCACVGGGYLQSAICNGGAGLLLQGRAGSKQTNGGGKLLASRAKNQCGQMRRLANWAKHVFRWPWHCTDRAIIVCLPRSLEGTVPKPKPIVQCSVKVPTNGMVLISTMQVIHDQNDLLLERVNRVRASTATNLRVTSCQRQSYLTDRGSHRSHSIIFGAYPDRTCTRTPIRKDRLNSGSCTVHSQPMFLNLLSAGRC